MSTRDEDDAWRAIVENFGDRALLDDAREEPEGEPPLRPSAPPFRAPTERNDDRTPPGAARDSDSGQRASGFVPFGPQPTPREPDRQEFVPEDVLPDDADTFVPPDVPLPRMRMSQVIAWIAALGAPVVFVVAALTGLRLGGLLSAVVALCFIGGFAWLVTTMPKEPPGPWDDGARV